MTKSELIDEVVSRFKDTYHPLKIYLYGSQVWGNPTEDSDFDFCIILKESEKSQAERIRDGLRALKGISIPIDILVLTENEIQGRVEHPSTLIYKVYTQGKKLYDTA
ncbi:MAG: nucleotidyltransferase domain-containing protein [Spirochaetaceae bacterium]|jgi:predicted nucleotidyltransferase|nr:nucleotidyltransferase domain-containing protein [Spirochaetaceae bacterium]